MTKEITAPTPSQIQDPIVYVDLSKSDIGELKGVGVGDSVRVIILGTVQAISQREDNKEKTGTITLVSKDVVVKDAPKGLADLLDEGDDSE